MTNERKQLKVLYDLGKAVVGLSSMEDVCQRIIAKTAALFNVGKASIMKFDVNDKVLKVIASKGMPADIASNARVMVGEGISGKVFKSAKPVLIKDIRTSGFETRRRYKGKSLMSAPVTCFPMHMGGEPVGVINVTDRKSGRSFSPEDLKLLAAIANQTAAYLHLCDLAEAARQTECFRRELELARAIQQKLLPSRPLKIPGFDIAGRCVTAEKVGGDYFDFLSGGVKPPSVVVADVAGHGIGAAMTMSAFRSAVRSGGVASFFSPAIAAERLNATLYSDLAVAEQFISMIFLQILPGDGDGHVIKYTTAGHHPPLIFKNGEFMNHSTRDALLGVEEFAEYHEKRIDVKGGDIIILYTDGLIEAASPAREKFGIERVKDFVRHNVGHPSEWLVDGLCKEAQTFAARRKIRDDITVVVIKAA